MRLLQRDRWQVLEPLLDEALRLDEPARASWLDELRSRAPDLVEDLVTLLSGESAADESGFLSDPVVASLAGLELGAWTLERPLGEGGMGSVWLARRSDGRFEGKAAVKLLNLSLRSTAGQEQFRVEGSLLARLTHARIARLLDAGVGPGGQPYLVLEYVEGKPLDVWSDERSLSVRDRLQLFEQVLDAVRHAHANLVVHRDLKPSNILVNAGGMVTLLDFGLAKLVQPETASSPGAPQTAHRWMTPEYASPEQVRGEQVTTRTDVYQLGAVLYRLLTGRVPFVRQDRHALEQAVLDEDPAPPSSVVELGERATLRGDLDAIVLKALRKRPDDRYASVDAMADDVRRFLSGHPISARRNSAAYRVRRYVQRHRTVFGAAVVALIVSLGYVATLVRERQRLEVALAEAQTGIRRAEHVTDFMLELFDNSVAGRTLTDSVTARELLEGGVSRVRELQRQPELQAQMLEVIGRIETQLGNYDRATPLLEEALSIRRRLHGNRHPDVATSLEALALVPELRHDARKLLELRQTAYDLRVDLSGPDDSRSVNALFRLGMALHVAGKYEASRAKFDEWMSRLERQPLEISETRATQLQRAADQLIYQREFGRAEAMLRQALAIKQQMFDDDHPSLADAMTSLASLHERTNRLAEAESIEREAVRILEKAYPEGHAELAQELRYLGILIQNQKRYEESLAPLRQAVDMHARTVGKQSIEYAMSLLNYSVANTANNLPTEAEALAREGMAILQQQLGAQNSMVYWSKIILGDALRGRKQYAQAESLLLSAWKRFETPRPMTKAWREYALAALVRLYDATGDSVKSANFRALRTTPGPP